MIGLLNCPIKKLSDNKQCDNKLSDDNLASAVEVNKGFFSPITVKEIVIFITNSESSQVFYLYFPYFDANL